MGTLHICFSFSYFSFPNKKTLAMWVYLLQSINTHQIQLIFLGSGTNFHEWSNLGQLLPWKDASETLSKTWTNSTNITRNEKWFQATSTIFNMTTTYDSSHLGYGWIWRLSLIKAFCQGKEKNGGSVTKPGPKSSIWCIDKRG